MVMKNVCSIHKNILGAKALAYKPVPVNVCVNFDLFRMRLMRGLISTRLLSGQNLV